MSAGNEERRSVFPDDAKVRGVVHRLVRPLVRDSKWLFLIPQHVLAVFEKVDICPLE